MKKIKITFISGLSIIYTMDVFDIALNDPEVIEIMDMDTGEILFNR